MRYYHDRQLFDIKTMASCYWAGFLAADGYVGSHGVITIGLSSKDRERLVQFKEFMGFNGPILDGQTSNGYPSSTINIYGAYECQAALASTFSVTNAKSLTLQPPNLSDEDHIRHFIRGYIDGDGSISYQGSGRNNHWVLSIVGTEAMLVWIKSCIKQFVNGVGNPSVNSGGSRTRSYQLAFGCYQVRPILDWLYEGSTNETRLKRKYEKYLEVKDFYREKRRYTSKYRGVNFVRRTDRWSAEIKQSGKRYHLGYFKSEADAARAYNAKAIGLGVPERAYIVYGPDSIGIL